MNQLLFEDHNYIRTFSRIKDELPTLKLFFMENMNKPNEINANQVEGVSKEIIAKFKLENA